MRLLLLLFLLPLLAAAQDDSDGNAIHAVTALFPDGSKSVTVTDPDKHTSEVSTYNAADKLMQKMVYTLGDDNQPVSGVVYDEHDRPIYKTVYKRDELNRIGEEDDYNMSDQFLRRLVFEFDATGRATGVRAYDAQGNELQGDDARKDRPPVMH